MRIDELKRIAKENDYELEKLKDYEEIVLIRKVSVDGFLANFITISLNFENQIFVKIIHCDDKDFNMIKAAVEFAETPIEDREEEKYYLVKFSEKEIEGIKKKFDTDLKDFELMEVENDIKTN